MLAVNGSGVMGASSMPNVTHVVSLAIELLHAGGKPSLQSFSGSSTFGNKAYVAPLDTV